ncbi:hypothetical protein QQX98_002564 [Neonectria punicea]|uniref:Uncharacterized protein n=1 Tax=Neonectria punicea TaxID=979145 RepID=A0ABR1HHY3_9HYPO
MMLLYVSYLGFLVLVFAGFVSADSDDDFSNNLISDFAPLLALFGERVTMQFLGQSMGWADCIILAMAPLGIITIIVSAIRVGGPSWLKFVVGRSRENILVAEMELMSSTSEEASELWNGVEVVRCSGEGRVKEFICLFSEKININSPVKIMTLSQAETDENKLFRKLGWFSHIHDLQTLSPMITIGTEPQPLDRYFRTPRWLQSQRPNVGNDDGTELNNNSNNNKRYSIYRMAQWLACWGIRLNLQPPADDEEATPRVTGDWVEMTPRVETQQSGTETTPDDESQQSEEIIILLNTNTEAPNITLNRHESADRRELRWVAAVGIVVQSVVLVYFHLLTEHFRFKKEGKPIQDHALPLSVTGTILVVLGVLSCAWVVDSSTTEERHQVTQGMRHQIIWLQTETTVSDQVFKSFALYLRKSPRVITTSKRAQFMTEARSSSTPSSQESPTESISPRGTWWSALPRDRPFMEKVSTVGAFISVSGIIIQFFGLRRMHWSASVAQLVAVLLMTMLRLLIRRRFTDRIDCHELRPRYELDEFAMSLGSLDQDHFYKQPPDSEPASSQESEETPHSLWGKLRQIVGWKGHSSGKELDLGFSQDTRSWTVVTGEDRSNLSELSSTELPTSPASTPGLITEPLDLDGGETRLPEKNTAHGIMVLRRCLTTLADWRGPASMEAICLAGAIEVTMNHLFPLNKNGPATTTSKTWSLEVGLGQGEKQIVVFQLDQRGGRWKACADQMEAALSLWLCSVERRQKKSATEDPSPASGPSSLNDGGWLRTEGSRLKPALTLLGKMDKTLTRNLQWWLPPDRPEVLAAKTKPEASDDDTGTEHQVDLCRVVGCGKAEFTLDDGDESRATNDPQTPTFWECSGVFQKDGWMTEEAIEDRKNGQKLLAVESYDALEKLYAKDMFSIFMWQAVRSLKQPFEDDCKILAVGSHQNPFRPRSSHLSKLALDIQKTGLGSLHDAYLALIPPLSYMGRLPGIDPIATMLHNTAKKHESLYKWDRAWITYRELHQLIGDVSKHSSTYFKVVAMMVEFLRTITMMNALDDSVGGGRRLQQDMEEKLLGRVSADFLSDLNTLYTYQDRAWNSRIFKDSREVCWDDTPGLMRCGFTKVHRWVVLARLASEHLGQVHSVEPPCNEEVEQHLNATDILGWTPLHYAGRDRIAFVQITLIQQGADVYAVDLRQRQPLHYACINGEPDAVSTLLSHGAEIDAPGNDGMTPMHCAALQGSGKVICLLSNKNAKTRAMDTFGRAPIHLAVMSRRLEAVLELIRDKDLMDRQGRSLHLAVLNSSEDIVAGLLENSALVHATHGRNVTPIHFAARSGNCAIIRKLIENNADVNARDCLGMTPLHFAILFQDDKSLEFLLQNGADVEARGFANGNPLHFAAGFGRASTIELLLKYEADVNAIGSDNTTPLWRAVDQGNPKVIDTLLAAKGIDLEISVIAYDGYTALHRARQLGWTSIVEKLVKAGAREFEGAVPVIVKMSPILNVIPRVAHDIRFG